MKSNRVFVFIFLLVLLLAAFPALADDAPLATNTPVVVIQPTAAAVNDVPVEATLVAPVDQTPVVVVDSPESTAMFWIFSAVIFGLLAVIVLVLRPLIVQLGASAPSWAVDAAFSGVGTLLASAGDYASTTPSPVDDDLVEELRKEIDSLKASIAEMRDRLSPPDTTGVG